ncbi:MAG: polymerase, sigma-24 subunit, subfamily protein [Frankiales bacterium]|nr:polymerase, sigma-24 subunit, subfamily protein [Frankiales bacterium]
MTFEEYVSARYLSLRRFAFLLCGDWAEAEDLVQDGLLRCHARWDRIARDDPHAYVRRAVLNGARNWRRARRLTGPLPESLEAAPVHIDDRLALVGALRALPLDQREVLVLRYFEQLSESEIASHLGVAPGTVKSRAARGLAALRAAGLSEEVGA